MDGRSSTSKPASPSPSSSSATDIKSNTARPTYSSKLGDPKAAVAAAAAAAAPPATARQPPQQQRAWTSNKNPITGRAQTPQQGNTNPQNNKPSATSSLREGQRVRITLSTGAEFEGVYNNGTEPTTCRLTMVQQKKLPNSADITNGAKRREQATMSFQRKEITEARVLPGNGGKADGKNTNGNRPGFRTDAAISNSRFAERTLQPWVPDAADGLDGSLEAGLSSAGLSSGGPPNWDQFEVNKRLFGLTTDYDENIYTTTIDRNNPSYKAKAAMADRAVQEINQSTPATAHVAEERIMDYSGAGDHVDEEEKYSGVRRQDLAISTNRENKYTPPARRAPTGQATVKGAPVDPAIISSQLKAVPTAKPPATKPEETKNTAQANKPAPASSTGSKAAEAKPAPSKEGAATATDKVESKQPEAAAADKAKPALATATVERDVLALFKNFASHQRDAAEKQRTTKAKQDKETKLVELKKFATSFKLSTPVPSDLIGIIAKDPMKQKEIQDKAIKNAKEIAKQKNQEKEAAAAKDAETKLSADQPAPSTTAAPVDSRSPSRPSVPQHANAPSGAQNRHTGPRNGYNNQPHYNQQYPRNNRQPQHLGGPQGPQQQGNLGPRMRSIDQHKMQNQHMNPHPGMMEMRIPPTGPANNADPTYGRRVSAMGPVFMGNKLNPNSSEFRPGGGFNVPQAFLPAGPSQGSSPRSLVNHIVEPPPIVPTPVAGQLIRRKTKGETAIDPKKFNILTHIQSIKPPQGPPQGRKWDDNDGLRPAFDTPPTWRQLKEEMEKADSTSLMTYSQYFEQRRPSVATPSTAPAVPSHVPPHQHQLPFHLQHGAQNMAPRQSPHLPPMPLHTGQHAHAPAPYTGPDDHRMMHSNSAQSFASPRMGQVPMAYPPAMNGPGQMQYGQPMMQQYMNPAAPPMAQFRSFSNNGQFMPQQQPQQMGGPMMVQQQFMGPNGMVTAGPQMAMYPHPHYMPPNAVPPQPMAGSNGFPSPGRPAAPMMASQGSHQGQQAMYMSPGMAYQQPAYPPQQPGGKFPGPRPQ
ncbi:hypothetical protein QBC39DRAFT_136555 [Podospora conica]|nr:hypothetical protein QBC39DRAFT_136555 [Schizothecium conicum]